MSAYEQLKQACLPQWRAYVGHRFVNQLRQGTLPLTVFQAFLVQDYLFLIQFARAHALAGYKSRTLDDLHQAHEALGAILDETRLHIELTSRWGIPRTELDKTPEQQATLAYTRFVLDAGSAGDLTDLNVALAPCVAGYAEIGRQLGPELETRPAHPYREWITSYADAHYQASTAATIDRLDAQIGPSPSTQRFDELVGFFRTATVLETGFFEQAFATAD